MNLDMPENKAQIITSTEAVGSVVERSIPETSMIDPVIDPVISDQLQADQLQADQLESMEAIEPTDPPTSPEAKPSYVKLAMRNMVKKRGLSLQHFFLTTIGLLAFLVGISYLTR